MEMIGARGSQNGVVQVSNLAANNLLQKFFIASNHFCHRDGSENGEEAKKEEEEEDKDLELSLGLSLNGQFGTDPRSRKRKNFELSRSSSIPEGFVFDEQRSGDMRRSTVRPVMFQLDRTRSLPVETDMEMEMETKRKRSEKKTRAFLEFRVPTKEKSIGRVDYGQKDGFTLSGGHNCETVKTRAFMEFQVSPTKEGTDHSRKDVFTLSPGRNETTENTGAFAEFQVPPIKEETNHHRNDGFTLSSGKSSDIEKKRAFREFQVSPTKEETNHGRKGGFTLSPGHNGATEKTRAFLKFQVPPPTKKESDHKRNDGYTLTPTNGRGKNGNTTTKKNAEVSGMEKARNFLEDMPCVSTREVGANGKRVEGFLYWYGGNKEEVKIVCVCHGSFLSPAEFVKHGGVNVSDDGVDDVTVNPLRHIVVKLPSSSL